MQPVIEFRDVSKRYFLNAGSRSLRTVFAELPRRLVGQSGMKVPEFWALRDVSFQVSPGESLGILGHNGAGKTTILKLLSEITYPTSGTIAVRGRMGSLIELGAGFHPEMTGRENVYLNGVILGMTRKEISQRFDSIVDFAGIEEFIDTPVKRYSSGMYVRLAFAVAAHIDPAVLLVDEVLAVGDIAFRAKCYRRMAELRKNGATIVLVSHDIYSIRDTCDRALLLWKGELLETGEPESVINTYMTRMQLIGTEPTTSFDETKGTCERASFSRPDSIKVNISYVTFSEDDSHSVKAVESGRHLCVDLQYEAEQQLVEPIFRLDFYRSGQFCTGFSTAYDQVPIGPIVGTGTVRLDIQALYLPPGIYSISAVIAERYETDVLDVHHQAYPLEITRARNSRGDVLLPHTWQLRPVDSSLFSG